LRLFRPTEDKRRPISAFDRYLNGQLAQLILIDFQVRWRISVSI
jgi:hypothetical protein